MSRERKSGKSSKPASETAAATKGRKTYSAPKVKSYGNIREITQGVGRSGQRDSAPGSHKTLG